MAERYYWPGEQTQLRANADEWVDAVVELSGDEAHHLVRVMRQKPGDLVTLFDGDGHEFSAEIIDTRKDRATLRIREVRAVDTESLRQVIVAVSLPKGDRQKWLVEKLTELGCYRLIPLQTERGVAQCSGQVPERLRRQVLEATKQCNRTRLMQISPERTIAECLAEFSSGNADEGLENAPAETSRWIAHPCSDGAFGQLRLADLMQTKLPQRVLVLVGPEGGFTSGEVEQAVTLGCRPLDLGPRILRVETAALMLTAVIAAKIR